MNTFICQKCNKAFQTKKQNKHIVLEVVLIVQIQ